MPGSAVFFSLLLLSGGRMKVYSSDKIRNIALLGHSSAGKTSLAEALLHATGATNRLGRVEDGTTVSDWDEDEIKRKQSISTSLIPCEWQGYKLNILDTPGYPDFVGEVISALRVAEAGLVVVDAVAGVEVGTELAWQYLDQAHKPRFVLINKMDRENAAYETALAAVREAFPGNFVPLFLPIGAQSAFQGVVSVLDGKAYLGRDGKEAPVPAELAEDLEKAQLALVEAAAESSDELLMKYLEGETLSPAEIASGLVAAIRSGSVVPVLCAASTQMIGIRAVLNAMTALVPSPDVAGPYPALRNGEAIELLDLRFLVGCQVSISSTSEARARALFEAARKAGADVVGACHIDTSKRPFEQDGWCEIWSRCNSAGEEV
jgi:elongation factor G